MSARHQGDTKTFPKLDAPGQAKSINGQVRSLEMAMARHVKDADPADQKAIGDKCKAQVERLLARLNTQYP